jgi:hypothetical protein
MATEPLLSNRKASRIFFQLLHERASPAQLARRLGMGQKECERLLARMERAGLVLQGPKGAREIDWERFVPLFVSQAMHIYSAAMPWKFVPYYMEKDPLHVIEAACARAERELAKTKVKLSGDDRFFRLVQDYFVSLATEVDVPEDYLADLRIQDAIDEFEYALLKLYPLVRRKRDRASASRVLVRMLGDWYRLIQSYDNTPTATALRSAFTKSDLM